MTAYWAACLASVATTWFAARVRHRREGAGYWLAVTFTAAFPLIFLAAVRYNVGADWPAYDRYYMSVLNGHGQGRYEILYFLANKLVALMRLSSPWMFGFAASLFLMPVYRRILSDSPYPYVSVFLLMGMTYYFYFLNGTRQMIGAAFLLLTVPLIEQRRFLPFLLYVLIATGFHNTCIVFIAVYFLVRMDLKPRTLILITLGVFVFGQYFANVVNRMLSGMEYYSDYLESTFAERGQGYVVLAMNVLLVIFATLFRPKDSPRYAIYYNLQVVALWASALTGKIVLIDRYRMVFGLASVILVPMCLRSISDRRLRRVLTALIVALYLVYAVYTVGMQNSNSVMPYRTIFSR